MVCPPMGVKKLVKNISRDRGLSTLFVHRDWRGFLESDHRHLALNVTAQVFRLKAED
jgi:hypothetical protein